MSRLVNLAEPISWNGPADPSTLNAMKHRIAVQRSEEGYSVSVPELPGCWSQGAIEEEALANIAEAIRDYCEVAKEHDSDSVRREIRAGLDDLENGRSFSQEEIEAFYPES